MMRKDLEYYVNLDYPVEIRKIPKRDGGGYLASIPQLGEKAFHADGRDVREALRNLRKVKRDLFAEYLKQGTRIPEPEPEPESIFSGKFIVRIPSSLHRQLVERAQRENVSLNQLVVYLLSYNVSLRVIESKLDDITGKFEAKWSARWAPQEYFGTPPLFTFQHKLIGRIGK
jgi:antitoxin HicB